MERELSSVKKPIGRVSNFQEQDIPTLAGHNKARCPGGYTSLKEDILHELQGQKPQEVLELTAALSRKVGRMISLAQQLEAALIGSREVDDKCKNIRDIAAGLFDAAEAADLVVAELVCAIAGLPVQLVESPLSSEGHGERVMKRRACCSLNAGPYVSNVRVFLVRMNRCTCGVFEVLMRLKEAQWQLLGYTDGVWGEEVVERLGQDYERLRTLEHNLVTLYELMSKCNHCIAA